MSARSRVLLPLLLGVGLAIPAARAGGGADDRVLECKAQSTAGALSWRVRLEPARQMAVVDDRELAAEYSSSHVRIPIPAEGRALYIGRVSGRLLVTTPAGATVAAGKCVARLWV